MSCDTRMQDSNDPAGQEKLIKLNTVGYDQLLTCKPERYRLLPRPRDACLTGAPGSGTMGP